MLKVTSKTQNTLNTPRDFARGSSQRYNNEGHKEMCIARKKIFVTQSYTEDAQRTTEEIIRQAQQPSTRFTFLLPGSCCHSQRLPYDRVF
jgi:hypothetical protein